MKRLSLFAMFLVCLLLTPAYGQEKWTEIGLYGFFPDIEGGLTTDYFTTDTDVSISDNLDNLDIGVMAYAEHRHGKWAFIGDVGYLKVADENATTRTTGTSVSPDAEIAHTLLEGFVGYRVFTKDQEKSQFGIDILAGARFNRVVFELESKIPVSGLTMLISRNLDADWTNGVIALRMQYGNSNGWGVDAWADMGAGSDSTSYQLAGSLSYLFSNNIRVIGGYRFYSIDYNAEKDGRRFALDLDYSGPMLGIAYRF